MNFKRIIINLFGLFAIAYIATSCEKDITIDLPDSEQKIVVEAEVILGEPIIMSLMQSTPYYSTVNQSTFEDLFERNADVKVWNSNGDTMQLMEICLDALPPEFAEEIAESFGFDVDSIEQLEDLPNVCFYVDEELILSQTPTFVGEENTTYYLEITRENGQVVTAETYIPFVDAPFQIEAVQHPDEEYQNWYRVEVSLDLPPTLGNYIRYRTGNGEEDYIAPGTSVYDDNTFTNSGNTITLPLERGYTDEELDDDIELSTYNYFEKTDSITTIYVEWSNIDYATYSFWNTLENDGGDSPFSSPVEIRGNINGGLGIFGGYATTYLEVEMN